MQFDFAFLFECWWPQQGQAPMDPLLMFIINISTSYKLKTKIIGAQVTSKRRIKTMRNFPPLLIWILNKNKSWRIKFFSTVIFFYKKMAKNYTETKNAHKNYETVALKISTREIFPWQTKFSFQLAGQTKEWGQRSDTESRFGLNHWEKNQ